jgi:hypothetical protein
MALPMSSPAPTPWAVICPQHGRVYLTREEYRVQMNRPNSGWECTEVVIEGPAPIGPCSNDSEWDDENYESREEIL